MLTLLGLSLASPHGFLSGSSGARSPAYGYSSMASASFVVNDSTHDPKLIHNTVINTMRGLPVVCSSPHAEGRRNRRAARRSGSSWVESLGHRPRGTGRPRVRTMRRYGARSTISHLVSLEPELVSGSSDLVSLW